MEARLISSMACVETLDWYTRRHMEWFYDWLNSSETLSANWG